MDDKVVERELERSRELSELALRCDRMRDVVERLVNWGESYFVGRGRADSLLDIVADARAALEVGHE